MGGAVSVPASGLFGDLLAGFPAAPGHVPCSPAHGHGHGPMHRVSFDDT
tara:strand:- start:1238 stop:1384 length:147 start_codon:yes stop_codon:yes gene_type:complete